MLPETSRSVLKLGGMCNSFKTGSQVCSKNQKVQGTTKTSFIADFFTSMWTAGLLKAESHLPSLGAVEGNEKKHFWTHSSLKHCSGQYWTGLNNQLPALLCSLAAPIYVVTRILRNEGKDIPSELITATVQSVIWNRLAPLLVLINVAPCLTGTGRWCSLGCRDCMADTTPSLLPLLCFSCGCWEMLACLELLTLINKSVAPEHDKWFSLIPSRHSLLGHSPPSAC